jgi:hypothetical protein
LRPERLKNRSHSNHYQSDNQRSRGPAPPATMAAIVDRIQACCCHKLCKFAIRLSSVWAKTTRPFLIVVKRSSSLQGILPPVTTRQFSTTDSSFQRPHILKILFFDFPSPRLRDEI